MPKFSIITAAYNAEPYMQTCAESVLSQTFRNWEWIVVDDGSTDSTGKILDSIATSDNRCRIFHRANNGQPSAMNYALDIANGEWILFLDSDDVWHTDLLQRLDQISDSATKHSLLRFNLMRFDDGDNPRLTSDSHNPVNVLDISMGIPFLDFFNPLYVCHAYNREELAAHRFSDYVRGNDRVFLNDLMLNKVDVIISIPDVLYGYRQHAKSIMHTRPNCRTLKDDFLSRVDIIDAITRSKKHVVYANHYWLEGYVLREYLNAVESGEYDKDDRIELLRAFYSSLPRLCRARGFSLLGRMSAWLYRLMPGYYGRYFVRSAFPSALSRLGIRNIGLVLCEK